MTRDGIWNIRNVAIDMVNSKPVTNKEKRFLELFIKIDDRYRDIVNFYYPSDAFLKELKTYFIKHHRGVKAIDPCCRNHGGCPACESNRNHSNLKRLQVAEEKLKNFLTNEESVL